MKTDLDRMVDVLNRNGYVPVPVGDGDESTLATKEYMVARVGYQDILCIGAGQSGDDGCHMKFYFVEGALMGHGCFEPEE